MDATAQWFALDSMRRGADADSDLWLDQGMQRAVPGDQPLASRASSREDAYLPLRTLAPYAGVSIRTLRAYLAQPVHPLPHYRTAGKILVKRSDFDAWMRQFRLSPDRRTEDVVSEILRSL